MNPYDPATAAASSDAVGSDDLPLPQHGDSELWARTRRRVVVLAVVPAALFVLAMLIPPLPPQDVIAVVTLGIWFIGFPCFLLLGSLLGLLPAFRSESTAQICRRRVAQAVCFFMAALLIVGDFWVFGLITGLKWGLWKYDFPLVAFAIALTLLCVPTRRQYARWSNSDAVIR